MSEQLTTAETTEEAVQAVYDSARELGEVIGREDVARILRDKSGDAYKRNQDEKAKILRGLADQIEEQAREMRWEWKKNTEDAGEKAWEYLLELGEPEQAAEAEEEGDA